VKIFYFRVHTSWILIFILVTVILTTQFSEDFQLWEKIVMGVSVAFLFLLATALRELVLALAAYRGKVPIREITLYAFGGVYQEFHKRIVSIHWPLLYISRQISNLVIAAIFYGLFATSVATDNSALAGMTQWLSYIFTLVFALNFIPAFPLDGGQILRSILWKSSGDYYKSTHLSAVTGWTVGLLVMFSSILVFVVSQQWIVSLVILITGWTIQSAANYTRLQFKTLITLQNIPAREIMETEYPVLSSEVNIDKLVRDYILIKDWHYLIVIDGQELQGILTFKQIKSVPMKRWNQTTIKDIMRPSSQIITADSQKPASALLEEMDIMDQEYIPIIEENRVTGVVTHSALISLAKTRSKFGI
jgi:Zn-dependent protease